MTRWCVESRVCGSPRNIVVSAETVNVPKACMSAGTNSPPQNFRRPTCSAHAHSDTPALGAHWCLTVRNDIFGSVSWIDNAPQKPQPEEEGHRRSPVRTRPMHQRTRSFTLSGQHTHKYRPRTGGAPRLREGTHAAPPSEKYQGIFGRKNKRKT